MVVQLVELEMVIMSGVNLMNDIRLKIWDRIFDLDIIYQNYSGEVSHNQKNIAATISSVDFNDSLDDLKRYIIKKNSFEMDEGTINNIFRYVIPKCVFIPSINEKQVFAIMCSYKFDLEHGIAVIYENGCFKEVGPQDIIL